MLLLASVVVMAIFGDTGLVRRHELMQERYRVDEHTEVLQKETAQLHRDLKLIQNQQLGLRRLAAQELRVAHEGSTIFVFDHEVE